MTVEEARKVLQEVLLHVDFVNLGRTVSAIGEYGYAWRTFDNSKWRPEKDQAWKDCLWLSENADRLYEALTAVRKDRLDRPYG
jgi:hypothetical protein